MARLAASGISIDLPKGWDAHIRAVGAPDHPRTVAAAAASARSEPSVLHAASFALPAERGDYGSGAVEVMDGSDVLVCLLEHEPEAADTVLFRRKGIPRLTHARFSPDSMQRAMPGMSGFQEFFQLGGRPFCLYVVIGSHRTGAPLVRQADAVVRSIQVS